MWSAVRPEIQNVYMSASDMVSENFKDGVAKEGVSALKLANILHEQYLSKPVTEVVLDDEDELSLRKVVTFMSSQYDDVVMPLKGYISKNKNLSLPTMFHDIMKTGVCSNLAPN